jgi:hypothetical protein
MANLRWVDVRIDRAVETGAKTYRLWSRKPSAPVLEICQRLGFVGFHRSLACWLTDNTAMRRTWCRRPFSALSAILAIDHRA